MTTNMKGIPHTFDNGNYIVDINCFEDINIINLLKGKKNKPYNTEYGVATNYTGKKYKKFKKTIKCPVFSFINTRFVDKSYINGNCLIFLNNFSPNLKDFRVYTISNIYIYNEITGQLFYVFFDNINFLERFMENISTIPIKNEQIDTIYYHPGKPSKINMIIPRIYENNILIKKYEDGVIKIDDYLHRLELGLEREAKLTIDHETKTISITERPNSIYDRYCTLKIDYEGLTINSFKCDYGTDTYSTKNSYKSKMFSQFIWNNYLRSDPSKTSLEIAQNIIDMIFIALD